MRYPTFADIIPTLHRSGRLSQAFDLLREGADPRSLTRQGATTLTMAAGTGCVELVQALLDAGVPVNQASKAGLTPLMRADNAEVAMLLLAAGADVDTATTRSGGTPTHGRTALMHAALRNSPAVIAALLGAGAAWSLRDSFGSTALLDAAANDRKEAVAALLAGGVPVDLCEAAALGDVRGVEERLSSAGEHDKELALWWAARAGQAGVVSYLLAEGVTPEASHPEGHTALATAAGLGHAETVDALVRGGADVAARTTHDPRTALIAAAFGRTPGHLRCARVLLDAGADPNAVTPGGWTALIAAAFQTDGSLVGLLLARGARTDACTLPDEDGVGGYTALQYAAMNTRARVMELLLAAGADPNATGLVGKTPLALARTRRDRPGADRRAITLLEAAGGHE